MVYRDTAYIDHILLRNTWLLKTFKKMNYCLV